MQESGGTLWFDIHVNQGGLLNYIRLGTSFLFDVPGFAWFPSTIEMNKAVSSPVQRFRVRSGRHASTRQVEGVVIQLSTLGELLYNIQFTRQKSRKFP